MMPSPLMAANLWDTLATWVANLAMRERDWVDHSTNHLDWTRLITSTQVHCSSPRRLQELCRNFDGVKVTTDI